MRKSSAARGCLWIFGAALFLVIFIMGMFAFAGWLEKYVWPGTISTQVDARPRPIPTTEPIRLVNQFGDICTKKKPKSSLQQPVTMDGTKTVFVYICKDGSSWTDKVLGP